MRLTPRDTRFYDLFGRAAANIVAGAALLSDLVQSGPANRPDIAQQMKAIEHAGDDVTHDIMRALNTSFITPFDREDIALLAARLDDVLDAMEAAADLMVLYRLEELPSEVTEQVRLLCEAGQVTAEAMPRLKTLNDLSSYWITINDLENQADAVYRKLLAGLFNADNADPILVIKTKEVVDQLEAAADAFEHAANVVQSIAAKES